jgi:hypothetical protein
MKAITVRQPWAWAIVHGHQTVESRPWGTRHRGTLYIHAGLQNDEDGFEMFGPDYEDLHGVVIGHVQVVGMRQFGPKDWEWELRDPRPLAVPIVARGLLGLWEFDLPQ